MSVTDRRLTRFIQQLLAQTGRPLGFADIGSGGPLKAEWLTLGTEHVTVHAVDPELWNDPKSLPLCISDRVHECDFYVAQDPRASSLHVANEEFIRRYGMTSMRRDRTLRVRCTTVDEFLAPHYAAIDAIDINVEGHDAQVLAGSTQLFAAGFVKCVKIEFETALAWDGQGWFSEIDGWLRTRGLELVRLDLDHVRQVSVQRLAHRGEPIWGKAYYLPTLSIWRERLANRPAVACRQDLLMGVALAAAIATPGRADELLTHIAPQVPSLRDEVAGWRRDLFEAYRFAELESQWTAAIRAGWQCLRRFPYGIRTLTRRSMID